LDALGVPWRYEPKRFDLGEFTYTPDFYLPDDGAYWEVKGWYTPNSRVKIEAFRLQHPEVPLVLFGKSCVELIERTASNVA